MVDCRPAELSDQHASGLNIEVLEDAQLLLIDQKKQEKLLKEIPKYENYTRILFQNG